jgi:hypothetical protein
MRVTPPENSPSIGNSVSLLLIAVCLVTAAVYYLTSTPYDLLRKLLTRA